MTDSEPQALSRPFARPHAPSCAEPTGHVYETDIAIVGAGLAGALAAVVLGRAGHRITLIDRYAEYPREFRVEKIAGDQVDLLGRLGMLDHIVAVSRPFNQVINVWRGNIIDRTYSPHYGIFYQDLVQAVRGQLPASVDFIVQRVSDIKNDADVQRITLANQDTINARLVVLATGVSDILRSKLGIARRVLFEKHSISFGFSIAPGTGHSFDFPALTYYGEHISDAIDYLNLFPVGDVMRANLFTFRDHRDPWIRELRREPRATLCGAMPGLSQYLGNFEIVDPVQNWIMDLYEIQNYRRDGIVLIGDAFQTSCPAAGTGVSRLLHDVERLCIHLPHWLDTPGMQAAKIAQFYDDPLKLASDARAARLAKYRRALTIGTGLRWEAHRRQVYLRRRVFGWIRQLKTAPASMTGASSTPLKRNMSRETMGAAGR